MAVGTAGSVKSCLRSSAHPTVLSLPSPMPVAPGPRRARMPFTTTMKPHARAGSWSSKGPGTLRSLRTGLASGAGASSTTVFCALAPQPC